MTEAIEKLALQEFESLAGCVSRGQASATYSDIIEKLTGHVVQLGDERRDFWQKECGRLGVKLQLPTA